MCHFDKYDLSKNELDTLIEQWIVGRNAARNREIVKKRLLDGFTYDALADMFYMSRAQIVRICYKGQEQVFRHVK